MKLEYPSCLPSGLSIQQLDDISESFKNNLGIKNRYNTIFSNSLKLFTETDLSAYNMCNAINGFKEIISSSSNRYNLVLGYNKLNSILGNNNVYIGSNLSLDHLQASNSITIGTNAHPVSDSVLIKSTDYNFILVNSGSITLTGSSIAIGRFATAHQPNMVSYSNYKIERDYDVQKINLVLLGKTEGSAFSGLYCDSNNTSMVLPNNSYFSGEVKITGYGVTDRRIAKYARQFVVERINSNVSFYEYTVLGSDINYTFTNLLSTDLLITTTNTSVNFNVRGVTGVWKWVANIDGMLVRF